MRREGDDANEAAVYREPMAARSTSIVRLSALLIAVIQVAGTYGATERQLDATAMVLVLVGPASLAFRDRWPLVAVAAAVAATDIYIWLGYAHGPIFISLVVAIFSAIQSGRRRSTLLVVAIGYLGFVAISLVDPRVELSSGGARGAAHRPRRAPPRRGRFRALLDAEPDMTVVGEAGDGEEAVRLTVEHRPDVVLMDIRMPGVDGLATTRRIADDQRLADAKVVILTTFDLDEYVFESAQGGSGRVPDEGHRARRAVAGGGERRRPAVAPGHPAAHRRVCRQGPLAGLGARFGPAHRPGTGRWWPWSPRVSATTRSPTGCS